MRVRVLLFAGLREAVGRKEHVLDVERDLTLAEVVARAELAIPEVGRYHGRLLVSLNESQVPLHTVVKNGDEVAFLPPMSGGAPRPWLQEQALSLDALLDEVRDPSVGGIATFIGVVRNQARGQAVDHLEYEAYEPMAEKEMRAIAEQVRERWPGARIALAHRVGRLEIGEAAVMIAVGTPHRAAAFEACRHAIDELKRRVPIWKKEFAQNGTYWVEENP